MLSNTAHSLQLAIQKLSKSPSIAAIDPGFGDWMWSIRFETWWHQMLQQAGDQIDAARRRAPAATPSPSDAYSNLNYKTRPIIDRAGTKKIAAVRMAQQGRIEDAYEQGALMEGIFLEALQSAGNEAKQIEAVWTLEAQHKDHVNQAMTEATKAFAAEGQRRKGASPYMRVAKLLGELNSAFGSGSGRAVGSITPAQIEAIEYEWAKKLNVQTGDGKLKARSLRQYLESNLVAFERLIGFPDVAWAEKMVRYTSLSLLRRLETGKLSNRVAQLLAKDEAKVKKAREAELAAADAVKAASGWAGITALGHRGLPPMPPGVPTDKEMRALWNLAGYGSQPGDKAIAFALGDETWLCALDAHGLPTWGGNRDGRFLRVGPASLLGGKPAKVVMRKLMNESGWDIGRAITRAPISKKHITGMSLESLKRTIDSLNSPKEVYDFEADGGTKTNFFGITSLFASHDERRWGLKGTHWLQPRGFLMSDATAVLMATDGHRLQLTAYPISAPESSSKRKWPGIPAAFEKAQNVRLYFDPHWLDDGYAATGRMVFPGIGETPDFTQLIPEFNPNDRHSFGDIVYEDIDLKTLRVLKSMKMPPVSTVYREVFAILGTDGVMKLHWTDEPSMKRQVQPVVKFYEAPRAGAIGFDPRYLKQMAKALLALKPASVVVRFVTPHSPVLFVARDRIDRVIGAHIIMPKRLD